MAEESEKRFETIMKKLFHPPPKPKPTSQNFSSGVQTLSGRKRPHSSIMGEKIESLLSGSAKPAQASACRPWDRDDFFRRLSTFKSTTWFAKPQVVSPLECARRGWINIDMDTIACASCDARILFSTPSVWTQQQGKQYFYESKILLQFEKAAAVFSLKLESGHKLLCPWINNACGEELAQFPIVSSTELIENYKKCFLALSNLIALPVISPVAIADMGSSKLEQFLEQSSTSAYQEPLESSRTKLPEHVPETISSDLYYQALKLTSLFGWEPHILPYKVDFKDGQVPLIRDANISVTAGQIKKISVYSLCTNEDTNTFRDLKLDPSSVVLDCNLCGANVGLWDFCTTPQPLEYLRFVGVTEVTSKNVTAPFTTSSGSTIAGGPPPAMLNYGATISLPIIGPNLRARLAMEKGSNDQLAIQKVHQVEGQTMSLESQSISEEGTADQNCEHNSKYPNNSLDIHGEGPSVKDKPVSLSIRESEKLSPTSKTKEFDPIKQHRYFCPWIMSSGKFSPGWQQTLSALVDHKELDKPPSSTLIEVDDDPVASVKRLFMSPT
ncbi:C3HC zinc finger-like [Striga hermonthica]|uniref:C3HC zinc finger-like n=1 Tax=Striga hermonthica TaxID=68872 RepID=A0A9N7R8F5_STRHE|nr:C3HC zinc finger-like [Striga hermonthica]